MGTNRLGEETLNTIGNLLPENVNGEEVINIIYERQQLIHFRLIHESEINRRLSELTGQEVNIPRDIRDELQKQVEAHHEQNTHMRGSNNDSYKAIKDLNRLKPEDITLENTKIDHEGKTQKDNNTIYAKLVASDGSAKDGKAAFGIFAKTKITEGAYNSNFFGGRVDGVQDNYRAELSGIQTIVQGMKEELLPHNHYVLEAKENEWEIDYEMPATDLLIASDSESSIKVINSYKGKTLAERLRTANRDIIIDIINHIERIQRDLKTRVHLLWVPAHTQDSNAKKEKTEKIKSFEEGIPDKTTRDKIIQANKGADECAELKRNTGKQVERNWKEDPTNTVDNLYLVETKTKEQTQEEHEKINEEAESEENSESEEEEEEEEEEEGLIEEEGPDHLAHRTTSLIDGSIYKFIKKKSKQNNTTNRKEKDGKRKKKEKETR
jgi:hypothetical protein